jgi:hypothetical protein
MVTTYYSGSCLRHAHKRQDKQNRDIVLDACQLSRFRCQCSRYIYRQAWSKPEQGIKRSHSPWGVEPYLGVLQMVRQDDVPPNEDDVLGLCQLVVVGHDQVRRSLGTSDFVVFQPREEKAWHLGCHTNRCDRLEVEEPGKPSLKRTKTSSLQH